MKALGKTAEMILAMVTRRGTMPEAMAVYIARTQGAEDAGETIAALIRGRYLHREGAMLMMPCGRCEICGRAGRYRVYSGTMACVRCAAYHGWKGGAPPPERKKL